MYEINKVLDFVAILVNAFVFWMLKYPNWQQKKNNQTPLSAVSGRKMVTPHIRRADSGNIDRHTRRAIRAMGVACKQPASPIIVKKGGGRWRGS